MADDAMRESPAEEMDQAAEQEEMESLLPEAAEDQEVATPEAPEAAAEASMESTEMADTETLPPAADVEAIGQIRPDNSPPDLSPRGEGGTDAQDAQADAGIELSDLLKREAQVQLAAALREVHLRLAVLQARGCFGDKGSETSSTKEDGSDQGQTTGMSESKDNEDEGEDDEDEQYEHVIEESIWEAVVLVGVPGVGIAGSVLMVAGLVVNMLLQALFILALVLDTLRWWAALGKPRHTPLQAVVAMPHGPLAEGEEPLSSSGLAESPEPLRWWLKAFLDESRIASLIGIIFCACVLLVWFLNISQEFVEIVSFSTSLMHLPRGKRTELIWCGYGSVLTSITRRRLCVMMFLVAIRSTVAAALLLLGTLWFMHTTSMLDLVLNAAVVAFILDLDEQVFLKFVPFRVRLILQDLLPLRTAPTHMSWVTPRMVLAGASVFTTIILLATVMWGPILPAALDVPPRATEL